MFGYISPDAPYLFKKDETLYKALYCGLCKGIGKGCGQTARSALTYDMAFVSALVHNINGEDVKIERAHCAIHWFKKRPIARPDDTTVAIGCVNTALAYYKLCDDKADGDRRGVLRHLYKKGFKKTLKKHPQVAEIIKKQTESLTALEKAGCDIIDAVCEPTALMMCELSDYLLGNYANENTKKLFYALGKWVYLIDALDDYDKDVKKKRYNVLYNVYGEQTRCAAVEKGREELEFIFDSLFASMREALSAIQFHFNHDLTDNIILRGIPLKTRSVFNGGCANKSRGNKNEQKKS
ncbi:MAG: hypothetical protein K2K80_00560 [Clostridia bacterium]|nr:hypothetical protein [Clostridia bacterium]